MSTTSKSEFEKLLSPPKEEKWREVAEFRKTNADWLNLSADIALKVMDEMDKQGQERTCRDRQGLAGTGRDWQGQAGTGRHGHAGAGTGKYSQGQV